MEASDEDYGARVRAAIAYGKVLDPEAAKIMGFGTKTLERVEKNVRELTIPEAKALALATGVPLEFLTDGWRHADAKLDEILDTLKNAEPVEDVVTRALAPLLELVESLKPPTEREPQNPPADEQQTAS